MSCYSQDISKTFGEKMWKKWKEVVLHLQCTCTLFARAVMHSCSLLMCQTNHWRTWHQLNIWNLTLSGRCLLSVSGSVSGDQLQGKQGLRGETQVGGVQRSSRLRRVPVQHGRDTTAHLHHRAEGRNVPVCRHEHATTRPVQKRTRENVLRWSKGSIFDAVSRTRLW